VLAHVAKLVAVPEQERSTAPQPGQAVLIRARSLGGAGSPCLRLADGSDVWVNVGSAQGPQAHCPAVS
jgi:hypothetical protein